MALEAGTRMGILGPPSTTVCMLIGNIKYVISEVEVELSYDFWWVRIPLTNSLHAEMNSALIILIAIEAANQYSSLYGIYHVRA